RDDQIEALMCLPVQHIAQHVLASVGDAVFFGELCAQLQHLGRKVNSGHLSSAFGEAGDKPAGSATDVADRHAAQVGGRTGPAPDPVKTLIGVAAQPAVQATRNRALVAGVNSIELVGDIVPVLRDLLRFVIGSAGSRHKNQSPWPYRRVRFRGSWCSFLLRAGSENDRACATDWCSDGGAN